MTTLRRRLTLNVPLTFAEDLRRAAGPSGDIERLVGFCFNAHMRMEADRPGPVFYARLACANRAPGPRERLELWLPTCQAEALADRAVSLNVPLGAFVAAMVGSVASRLAAA